MLQFAKLALQQGVLGQMPHSYAPAPQAFIVPQYPGNSSSYRVEHGNMGQRAIRGSSKGPPFTSLPLWTVVRKCCVKWLQLHCAMFVRVTSL